LFAHAAARSRSDPTPSRARAHPAAMWRWKHQMSCTNRLARWHAQPTTNRRKASVVSLTVSDAPIGCSSADRSLRLRLPTGTSSKCDGRRASALCHCRAGSRLALITLIPLSSYPAHPSLSNIIIQAVCCFLNGPLRTMERLGLLSRTGGSWAVLGTLDMRRRFSMAVERNAQEIGLGGVCHGGH
jgi:hypothetical protein